ncbi:halocyanin domain-containing protein [Natronomonas sp. EA1]|uniref:halocyanin domain-containing protein n=1 Tax=Natronomonas sp. EA1 TaxID=3421655 RepID=UPI003EB7F205
MPTRRAFIKTAAIGLGTALAARPVAAGTDLTDWLAKTDGAGQVVDKTGKKQVEITVGASGNGGAFGFGPPVLRVDPGTKVTWRWTGKGGSHNVVASDGSFESPMQTEGTYSTTVENAGVIRYYCAPHKAMGMRGALVVGDAQVTLPGSGTPTPTPGNESAGENQETPEEKPSFDGWLANTENYDGVHDLRGKDEVTVKVGAQGNGGPLAFEPAAIHVDAGTVVRFRWVGPRQYDVVDPELDIASEQVAKKGHEYAVRFDGDGLATYACTEYGDQGMRGVVIVGDGPQERLTWQGVGAGGGLAALLAAPLALGLRLHERTATNGKD